MTDATLERGGNQNCSRVSIGEFRGMVDSLPALVDTSTVAALGGVSERQIQRMAKAGKIPCVRIGNRFRFNTATILELFGLK